MNIIKKIMSCGSCGTNESHDDNMEKKEGKEYKCGSCGSKSQGEAGTCCGTDRKECECKDGVCKCD